MADILLTGVYTSIKRQFQAMGAIDARFDQDFIDAVNRTTSEINLLADLESTIPTIETREDTLTNLDIRHEYTLIHGITYWMMVLGRRPAKGADDMIKMHRDAFEKGVSQVWKYNYVTGDGLNDDDDGGVGLGNFDD